MFAINESLETIDFGTGVGSNSTTDLNSMFKDCRRLQLDCSNWNVRSDVNCNAFNENTPSVILPKIWQLTSSSERMKVTPEPSGATFAIQPMGKPTANSI